MKSSFIFYLLGIADIVILFYNLGQTFKWLTCMETNTPYILELREYNAISETPDTQRECSIGLGAWGE